jgi:tetratricopeptide (TPR) repeat protein
VSEEEIERAFLDALAARGRGDVDQAEERLRAVIAAEPRFAEPHLELAALLLETERLDDAEGHAREGLSALDATGVWVEDIEEHEVRALAHRTLGTVLRRRLEEDDSLVFGDPGAFRAVVDECRTHLAEAARLDPEDQESAVTSALLGDDEPEGT